MTKQTDVFIEHYLDKLTEGAIATIQTIRER
jgi:hypothetical protein